MEPTSELYGALQKAYAHFNDTLFEGKLPKVIFTTQRKKGMLGYFAPDKWVSVNGEKCHEIAINPSYVAKVSTIQVLDTLVHEQCHLHQHCFGKPSKRAYHNKEWADLMESVGLMPTSTGKPGGKKTGEKMSDYPIIGGKFLEACKELLSQGFSLPWVDSEANVSHKTIKLPYIDGNNDGAELPPSVKASLDEAQSGDFQPITLTTNADGSVVDEAGNVISTPPPPKKPKNKLKYTCPECNINVWGKPNIEIKCIPCNVQFIEAG